MPPVAEPDDNRSGTILGDILGDIIQVAGSCRPSVRQYASPENLDGRIRRAGLLDEKVRPGRVLYQQVARGPPPSAEGKTCTSAPPPT